MRYPDWQPMKTAPRRPPDYYGTSGPTILGWELVNEEGDGTFVVMWWERGFGWSDGFRRPVRPVRWAQVREPKLPKSMVKKCGNCGEPMKIGGDDGHTKRRLYCSDYCRVTASRRKAKGAQK